jgi:Cdc6-like AAA superfamily ATPase
MLLSTVGQIRGLEYMAPPIAEAATDIFCDLVELVGHISVHYRQKINSLRPDSTVSVNFDATFGKELNNIWRSKEALYDRIWSYKLGNKHYSLGLGSLRRKLQPSAELSIRTSLYDEVLESLDRSEDTCHWIKNDLIQFFKSQEQVLSITGPPGSGKTVLAEWVSERLARPLDRRTYVILEYNFRESSQHTISSR